MSMMRSVYVLHPCIWILCNWYVLSTYYSGVLIQIGMEPLRNKTDIRLFSCLFIFCKSAIFVITLCTYKNKSTLPTISTVIETE